MIRIAKAAMVAATLLISTSALAQSTQDMNLLTPEERKEFSVRLQTSGDSSMRAKITAEMNRLVQQRRLELRRKQREEAKQNNVGNKGAH
ncbi:hypothetical protein ACFL12_06475 [Pseudomonadota bacterium]